MKNLGLGYVKTSTVENFTTESGIKIRRYMSPIVRKALKLATKRTVYLESYPNLESNTPYIFASTHSFDEDIIAALSIIDRNAYVLLGTTDQIDHNPQMYAAWLNGMIYVDRLDADSRKEATKKMERILNSGTSVLLFPEGGWNNTENLLCQPLFAGPYILAQKTKAKVVPIASFNEPNSNDIFIKVGEPMDFTGKEKKEALRELRDSLATMMFEHIEHHSTPIVRSQLGEDQHLDFMEVRRKEYMRVKWTRDVWDEELAFYHDKDQPLPIKIRESFDKVVITRHNAYIMAPIIERRLEDEKYNFKIYMKKKTKQ
ncbi:MAG: 1-acyl-sn-glycerol-3-phosphate acyltransferase [Bacilli bacterium]|jgi:1-acyl-sn-glycerol-3-phosphate acyltransferase|nr:1-acyl-sn-glycerol-3-phosphate acyltransferase [Bacilli bacterium]